MSKKDKEPTEKVYEVGPDLISDVYKGFLQSSPHRSRSTVPTSPTPEPDENEVISAEFYNLCHIHKLKLEANRSEAEARLERRRQRRDENRRREEARRLWEKQNNPQNLAECAAKIQKVAKGRAVRDRFYQIKASLEDRPKKRALFIVVDRYDDKRIRPTNLLREDAVEMSKILREWGFHVDILCASSGIPSAQPTKANISNALAEAAKCGGDTMLWVHVCGSGGTASVNGKNPHRQAQKEKLMLQTPRTRLLRALESSHRKSGSLASGDVCHFLMPSDGKSSRLSFENIITFDEILDVLDGKHGVEIYGRPLNQRIVTVDIAPFGWVDGLQGGGCATIASTATGQHFYEYSNPTPLDEVQPKRIGVLSQCLLECLRGAEWKRPEKKQLSIDDSNEPSESDFALQPSGSTTSGYRPPALPDPKLAPYLTVSAVARYVEKTMESTYIACERRGHRWGDIPLLKGEKVNEVNMYFEKIWATTMTPIPPIPGSPEAETQSLTQSTVIGAKGAKKRKKTASMSRSCFACVDIRLDFTDEANRMEIFHPDFHTVISQYVTILSQQDPSQPPHRYYKAVFHPGFDGPPVLTIGINGTFIDVASKCKTKGAEATVWAELEEKLSEGMDLKISICCGKTEEGGVAVCIEIPNADALKRVLERVSLIPGITNGFVCSTLAIDLRLNVTINVAGVEKLQTFARGLASIQPVEAANTLNTSALMREETEDIGNTTFSATRMLGATQALDQTQTLRGDATMSGSVNTKKRSLVGNADDEVDTEKATGVQLTVNIRRKSNQAKLTLERFLSLALANSNVTKTDFIQKVAHGHPLAVRIVDAQQMAQRLNDLDDDALDCAKRRERPQGSPMPYNHPGLAICAVAIAGGTSEQRINQVRELYKAHAKYEGFYSIRFLLWDASDVIKIDAKDLSHPREKMAKLLERVRVAASIRGLPALLLFDLVRKKTFRVRPLDTGASPSPIPTIAAHSNMTMSVNPTPLPAVERSVAFGTSTNTGKPMSLSPAALNASINTMMLPSPSAKQSPNNLTSPSAAAIHSNQSHLATQFYKHPAVAHFCEEFVKGALNDLLPPVKGARAYGKGVRNTKYSLLAI